MPDANFREEGGLTNVTPVPVPLPSSPGKDATVRATLAKEDRLKKHPKRHRCCRGWGRKPTPTPGKEDGQTQVTPVSACFIVIIPGTDEGSIARNMLAGKNLDAFHLFFQWLFSFTTKHSLFLFNVKLNFCFLQIIIK